MAGSIEHSSPSPPLVATTLRCRHLKTEEGGSLRWRQAAVPAHRRPTFSARRQARALHGSATPRALPRWPIGATGFPTMDGGTLFCGPRAGRCSSLIKLGATPVCVPSGSGGAGRPEPLLPLPLLIVAARSHPGRGPRGRPSGGKRPRVGGIPPTPPRDPPSCSPALQPAMCDDAVASGGGSTPDGDLATQSVA